MKVERFVRDPRESGRVKGGRWEATPCTCAWCKAVLEQPPRAKPERPDAHHVNARPTPWSVRCPAHGRLYLTWHGYVQQLVDPDEGWRCPLCLTATTFDGENLGAFEDALKAEEDAARVAKSTKKKGPGSAVDPGPRTEMTQDPNGTTEGVTEW
jgi:hypothetical protein